MSRPESPPEPIVPLWSAADAAAATGGRCEGRDTWAATGVSIDTRTLSPGDLFVALADTRDGHDFVAQALERGAAAALVARRPDGVSDDAPLLVVPDVLGALTALGRAARARTAARIVAITGSAGKTSTKEMLRAMLSGQGAVHAAEASYNNHWGVPLTLARMPAATDFAVIEIGMNHPGEIAPLARLALPDVVLITTVAAAHLEAFDGVDDIAREKASILEGLRPGGTAILNADLDTTPILREAARAAGATQVLFGTDPGADMRLTGTTAAAGTSVLHLSDSGTAFALRLAAPGRHLAMNALGALAAAKALGADTALSAINIGRWMPSEGRGRRETVMLDPVESHSIDLIDDAFNANPASLSAALDVLAESLPTDGVGRVRAGRRIAILADMLELGPTGPDLHAAFARHAAMDRIDIVHCVGPLMRHLWDALPEARRGRLVDAAGDLAAIAHRLVDAGDVILVKGSKTTRVSTVADAIRNLGRDRAQPR